jgi:uncharacterized membrane protein
MSDYSSPEITQDDKLWAALGYIIPIISIILLFLEDKKNRPFIRFHAVQSIIFNIVLFVLIFVISFITLGLGAICAPLLWLVVFWPAYDSFQGHYTQIPVLTNFMKNQGWA